MSDYSTEYGVFTDEGCIEGPLYGLTEAQSRLSYWENEGEVVRVARLCVECMEEYDYCECEEEEE